MGKRGPKPGCKLGGRQRGTPNKLTGQVREMILAALDAAGGVEYLRKQADESPAAFLSLIGKILPLQLTGANGGVIAVEDVTERRRIIEREVALLLGVTVPAAQPEVMH